MQVINDVSILPNPYPPGVEAAIITQSAQLVGSDKRRPTPLSEVYVHHFFGDGRFLQVCPLRSFARNLQSTYGLRVRSTYGLKVLELCIQGPISMMLTTTVPSTAGSCPELYTLSCALHLAS